MEPVVEKVARGDAEHRLMSHSHSMNEALEDKSLVACPNCDLLQRLPEIGPGESVRCARCSSELWRRKNDSLNRTLALAVAALVLWIIVNTLPMLGLTAVGVVSFTTLFRGAELLWEHGEPLVAAMVFFAAIFAPALQIGFTLFVVISTMRGNPPVWVGFLMRQVPFTRVWSMIEVLLVGVLVSLTKIAEYATVIPGHALFAVGGLVVVLTAMQASFDSREVWERVEWVQARKQKKAAEKLLTEAAS
jgi:paraquat-inducible protein A